MDNPAVRQESRYEPASVIPLKNKHSLLDWLSSENRLIPREIEEETQILKEEEDMAGLMEDVEDNDYEDDEQNTEDEQM